MRTICQRRHNCENGYAIKIAGLGVLIYLEATKAGRWTCEEFEFRRLIGDCAIDCV